MIINHNLGAMNANRNMNINSSKASKSMEKLSSGLRINKAGDDAAGLAISEKMRGQIRGLDQASSNAQNAISLIGTGEGALNETHSILQRMRELAVQSSSDTNVGTDRKQIQGEVDELAKEISRISNDTEFNQKNLLGGNLNDTYQVGANADQNIKLTVQAMDAKSLGVSGDTTVTTGVAGSDITTATFGTSVGDKVVDLAPLTLEYAAGDVATKGADTVGSTATAATVVTGGILNLKIDGTVVDVTIGDGDTAAAIVTAINSAADTALGTSGSTYASLNVGVLEIASLTTGTTSQTEVAGATGASNSILADLKLSVAAGATGANATSDTVTISNGKPADDQVLNIVDSAATSLAITTGNYSGLTITAAALSGLDGSANSTVTVAQTITDSTAATFAPDGTMTKAAVVAGIDVSSQTTANAAIETINDAIETVSTERSKLGAYTNRLEHTIANLGTSSENLTSAESRIRDVDMAKEMSTFSKNNILNQAAQAMLAQANQQPQQVLALLR